MAKTIIGIVTSDKADKTIVITAHERKTHPLYRKQYSVSAKFMAHDPKNEASVGDKVSIIECRPISARKRFVLDKIIEKPKLRQENLEAVKVDDSGHKDSKSKKTDEEPEVEKAEAKAKEEKVK
ncbi:MAG TPA: 30S ribosomal protein S17 [Candidatus Sulfotelmatobacter sp.]|nr:30S ribosomal protein S17 [Candidatus Sulfotelmatobacter sp.]